MPGDKEPHFGSDKVEWIVENYEVLADGRWPQKSSGYIDNPFAPPASRSHSSAYFETPMAVLAEFHTRIQLCGPDGDLFLCVRCLKYEETIFRRALGLEIQEFDRKMSRVFAYIKGKRKSRSYAEFVRHYSPQNSGAFNRNRPRQ